MNPITKIVKKLSQNARSKRADIFRRQFSINKNTKILDLGSENGSNINNILKKTKADPRNVYIADINSESVNEGNRLFGYQAFTIDESKPLPFPNKYFDIVFCSSVIEHVTLPKEDIWHSFSGADFKLKSFERQKKIANEIKRLGKQYFVQTPYKYYIFESHTWLPFITCFPRQLLVPFLRFSNQFWIKKTSPDWNLLSKKDMAELFEDAILLEEKTWGLTKSIMAIRVL